MKSTLVERLEMMPDQTKILESHTQKTKLETVRLEPPPEKGKILLSCSDPSLLQNEKLLRTCLDFVREYNKRRAE